jgi:hypothetical protein
MQIQNLEINILYYLCNPLSGREEDGTAMDKDLVEKFSDIPEEAIQSAIDTMIADDLIRRNPPKSHLTITAKGLKQLRTSVAYHVHNFDCLFNHQ